MQLIHVVLLNEMILSAQVEDAYAKNIAKLSKKHYITSKSALGYKQKTLNKFLI